MNNKKQKTLNTTHQTVQYNDLATYSMPLSMLHVINIDRPITTVDDWRHELSIINSATENDILHLKIATGGGDAITMVAFIDALRKSPAWIITEILGECCSAGTGIFLQGNEFIINPLLLDFMVHQPSHGYGGTDSNVFDYAQHSRKTNIKIMKDVYKDFLTEDEMELVLNGKEVWLDAEQLEERCDALLRKREEYNQAQQTPSLTISYDTFKDLSKEEILKELFGDISKEELEESQQELTKGLGAYTKKELISTYPSCNLKMRMTKEEMIEVILSS